MQQNIGILQRVPLFAVFLLHLEDVGVDPDDCHGDVAQAELWPFQGDVDNNVRIFLEARCNPLPDSVQFGQFAHKIRPFCNRRPPGAAGRPLASAEVFADIGLVVILLFDPDKHRAVRLLRLLRNLVSGTPSVQHGFVAGDFIVVEPALLLPGQAAVIFLGKYQGLQDARCLNTLHLIHLPQHPSGQNGMPD